MATGAAIAAVVAIIPPPVAPTNSAPALCNVEMAEAPIPVVADALIMEEATLAAVTPGALNPNVLATAPTVPVSQLVITAAAVPAVAALVCDITF